MDEQHANSMTRPPIQGAAILVLAMALLAAGCPDGESENRRRGPDSRLCPGLDRNLDGDGVAVFEVPDPAENSVVLAMRVDDTGRILAAGTVYRGFRSYQAAVWALLPDGAPDPSFGTDGRAISGTSTDGEQGLSMSLDSAGRIVVGGMVVNPFTGADAAIWRFLPSGALDAAFGSGGWVRRNDAPPGWVHDRDGQVIHDGSDRILLAAIVGGSDVLVRAFLDDGALDPAFGSSGLSFHPDLAGPGSWETVSGIAVDSMDRVLVTGSTEGRTAGDDAFVIRVASSGGLDGTFGNGGVVLLDEPGPGSDQRAIGVTVDPIGRVLLTGWAYPVVGGPMTIWRLQADGSPDRTFGGAGFVVDTDGGPSSGRSGGAAVLVDPAGDIYVAGSAGFDAWKRQMAIWRYDDAGVLDPTFGCSGRIADPGPQPEMSYTHASAIDLDALGRVVVAGAYTETSGRGEPTLWRVWP